METTIAKKNYDEEVKEWWNKVNSKTLALFFENLEKADAAPPYHNIGRGNYKIIQINSETLLARMGSHYFILYPVTSEYIQLVFPFDKFYGNLYGM